MTLNNLDSDDTNTTLDNLDNDTTIHQDEEQQEQEQQEQEQEQQQRGDDKGAESSKKRPIPGDDNFDENNAPAHFVINEWAQGTSIHGVPYVTNSILWHMWKRAVWIALVIISSSFMIWQISLLIAEYRTFDVITDTHTENPIVLGFPEVTVCNANPHSRSRREELGIEAPQSEEELFKISTPLEEFVKETWFNGHHLNTSQVWRPQIIQDLGRCWSFTTQEKVQRTGHNFGLKVHLDLNQDDYELSTPFGSAFVWALQQGSQVSVHDTPLGTKPGKETFVGLELTQYEREKTAPWARCRGEAPEYTQSQCRDECANRYVRENCLCRSSQDTEDDSMRLCEIHGRDERCTQQAVENINEVIGNCDCDKPPCFEQIYDYVVYEIDPSEVAIDYWANSRNVTTEHVRKNYLSVTFNFRKMQYKKLTESRGMSFSQLLGSIGGSMGFFLGISLVSIFELFGDLVGMRLLPRLFGRKHLYGLGAHYKSE